MIDAFYCVYVVARRLSDHHRFNGNYVCPVFLGITTFIGMWNLMGFVSRSVGKSHNSSHGFLCSSVAQ